VPTDCWLPNGNADMQGCAASRGDRTQYALMMIVNVQLKCAGGTVKHVLGSTQPPGRPGEPSSSAPLTACWVRVHWSGPFPWDIGCWLTWMVAAPGATPHHPTDHSRARVQPPKRTVGLMVEILGGNITTVNQYSANDRTIAKNRSKSILASPGQLDPRTYLLRQRVGRGSGSVGDQSFRKAFGNDPGDLLAEQFIALISELFFRLHIQQDNSPILVHHHHRIRSCL
jgi:hypothetical protein